MEYKICMAYKALEVKDLFDALSDWCLHGALMAIAISAIGGYTAILWSIEFAVHLSTISALVAACALVGYVIFVSVSAVAKQAMKCCGWDEVELEGMRGYNVNA